LKGREGATPYNPSALPSLSPIYFWQVPRLILLSHSPLMHAPKTMSALKADSMEREPSLVRDEQRILRVKADAPPQGHGVGSK